MYPIAQLPQPSTDHICSSEIGRRALFLAVSEVNHEISHEILKTGVDANSVDKDGRTALTNLCAQGRDVIRKHKATFVEPSQYEQIVRLLLSHGLEIGARDHLLRTALHWATVRENEAMTAVLLGICHENEENVAYINAQDRSKKTALHIAAAKSSVHIVELLLQYGADLMATTQAAWTPLHNAAKEGKTEILQMLLDYNADAEAVTDNGRTALHWAAENGHTDCVQCLIPHTRSRRHAKDAKGKSPWMLAARRHHNSIMHLLSPFNDAEHLSPLAKKVCEEQHALVTDIHPQKQGQDKYISFQKPSVYNLLYATKDATKDRKPSPLFSVRAKKESIEKNGYRWIHLPANNVSSILNGETQVIILEYANLFMTRSDGMG